jgi:hypothetical protein
VVEDGERCEEAIAATMLLAGLVQHTKENCSMKAALKPMALLRAIAASPEKAKCIIQQAIAFRASRRPPKPTQAKPANVKRSRAECAE